MPSAVLAATQAVKAQPAAQKMKAKGGAPATATDPTLPVHKTELTTLRQIRSQAAAVLQALSAAPSLQPTASAVASSSQRPAQVTTEPAEPAAKSRAAAKPASKAAKGAGKKTPGGPCDVCLITGE